jgi:hypothetical protein
MVKDNADEHNNENNLVFLILLLISSLEAVFHLSFQRADSTHRKNVLQDESSCFNRKFIPADLNGKTGIADFNSARDVAANVAANDRSGTFYIIQKIRADKRLHQG